MQAMVKKTQFKSFNRFFPNNRLIVSFFIIGIILRLVFFKSHVWLGSDITRDISISLEALERGEVPLTGSFSSAGPFVFGPTLYWLYMFTFLLFPFSLLTPWYTAFVVSILVIGCFYYLANKSESRILFGFTALITAISPQLVQIASSPTQHTYVLIFTLFSLILLYNFYSTRKLFWAFLGGISIGLAINMHYQALNLLALPVIVLFFKAANFKKRIVSLLVVACGIAIAILPLSIWDFGQSFANFRNLLDYLLIGQGRVYVPNSWKLYLFEYLPNNWAYVTGLPSFFGLILLFGGSLVWFFDFIRTRKLSFIFLINTVFLFMLFLGRYYRGERFPGYTMYMLPFMIIFSTWTISKILDFIPDVTWGNNLKYSLIVILSLSIIFSSFTQLRGKLQENPSYSEIKNATAKLIAEYPGEKFRVLNLASTNPDASYAVTVYLQHKRFYAFDNSLKVGFCNGCPESINKLGELFGTSYFKIDDDKLNTAWQGVSQREIYDSTIGWLSKHQLKSTFQLDKYLNEKLFSLI